MSGCPKMVVGDSKKIRTVVANLTANAGLCSTSLWFDSIDGTSVYSQIYQGGKGYGVLSSIQGTSRPPKLEGSCS